MSFTATLRVWFALLGGAFITYGTCLALHGHGSDPISGALAEGWGAWFWPPFAIAAGLLTLIGTWVPRQGPGWQSWCVRLGLALTFGFGLARTVGLISIVVSHRNEVAVLIMMRQAALWMPVWGSAWMTLIMRHTWRQGV